MTRTSERLDEMEARLEGMEARIEARIMVSVDEKLVKVDKRIGRMEVNSEKNLLKIRQLMGKHAEDEQGSSSHREDEKGSNSSHLDMDQYRMAVKKVELPSFNGDDPIGWITRAETYFEVQNTGEEVKIKLAKLSMERVLPSIGLIY